MNKVFILYFFAGEHLNNRQVISLYSKEEEAKKVIKREGYINYFDGKYTNPYIKDGSMYILAEYTLDTGKNIV
jgi:hypothetical protein